MTKVKVCQKGNSINLKINFTKKVSIIQILLVVIFNAVVSAQNQSKIQIDVEAPLKFSVGYKTQQQFDYKGLATITAPQFNTYRNPVFGFNLSALYRLSESFKIGIGSGINGEFFDESAFVANEYYNRLMVPVYGKLRYQSTIKEKIIVLSDINFGYQIFDNRMLNDSNGYYFIDKGGLMSGVDVGAGYIIANYKLYLKLGYEINQYNHTMRLDWGSLPYLTSADKINYKSYFHIFIFTIGITI